ncbi:hypothetical protein HY413_01945 [Candidatus Kaiserbacteria bacterium]|nr:hypothetical protein [Candidatus Kaiserbacteria bacterium]
MRTVSSKFIVSAVLYVGLFIAGILGTTIRAEAATMPAVCVNAPTIENFKPYVYEDGDLHSFDYTVVGDGTPVATATVVGGHALESRFTTYWQTGTTQATKLHVDVPSWYGIAGEVHIMVSVMTATSIDCVVQKEFVVQLPTRHLTAPTPVTPTHPATPTGTSSTTKLAEKGKTTHTDKKPDVNEGKGMVGSGITDTVMLGKQCKSWPKMTWIFLILICIVAVFVIIDSLPYLLAGNGVRFAVTLLVMFLVLLALWFMFDRCREHRWFPIAVTLLTLGTLVMPTTLDGKKKTKRFPF